MFAILARLLHVLDLHVHVILLVDFHCLLYPTPNARFLNLCVNGRVQLNLGDHSPAQGRPWARSGVDYCLYLIGLPKRCRRLSLALTSLKIVVSPREFSFVVCLYGF